MSHEVFQSPPAEVFIDVALIQALLSNQHPELAHLNIRIVEAGWDNVMARLGNDLAVRLPRRSMGGPRIRNEQMWLPDLAKILPVAVPEIIKSNGPCEVFPFPWSIQKWLPGIAADLAPLAASEAGVLANFLTVLHKTPAPETLIPNPSRSGSLRSRRAEVAHMMSALQSQTDIISPEVLQVWNAALEAQNKDPLCWISGDIHARNVLGQDGKITAFIDWGDMCCGDRAVDLASIWSLFETAQARQHAAKAYGMNGDMSLRAKGWAIFFGVFLTVTGRRDTPRHARMGEAILNRITQDGLL